MINTFNLVIKMKDRDIHYQYISRVAVKHYLEYYQESEKYLGYSIGDA